MLAALVGVGAEALAIAASPAGSARWNEAAVGAVIVAYAVVGLVIVWHRPGHPIGRLALAIAAVWGVAEALVATSYAVLAQHPDARLAALGSALGSFLRGLPWFAAVMWLPLRFPDGLPAITRLGRFAERFTLVTIAVFSVVSLFSPTLTDLRVQHIDNPIGAPPSWAPAFEILAGVALLLGIGAVGLAVAVLVQKYRRGGPLGRQQTLIFGPRSSRRSRPWSPASRTPPARGCSPSRRSRSRSPSASPSCSDASTTSSSRSTAP